MAVKGKFGFVILIVLAVSIGMYCWLYSRHRDGLAQVAEEVTSAAQSAEAGDLRAAEDLLSKTKTDIETFDRWYAVPSIRRRARSLRNQAASIRSDISSRIGEFRSVSQTIQKCMRDNESDKAKTALKFSQSKFSMPDPTLSAMSDFLDLVISHEFSAAEQTLTRMSSRLPERHGVKSINDTLRNVVTEETYRHTIRSMSQEVMKHLHSGSYVLAKEAVSTAQSSLTKSDPVLKSIMRRIDRLNSRKPGERDVRFFRNVVKDSLNWKRTRGKDTTTAYEAFLRNHPDSVFAEEARSRIVDLEVADIMKGDHGRLPPATRLRGNRARSFSIINIHNDTRYQLTVRYSGPESFKVTFLSRQKGCIEALQGSYKVAASVEASHVRNYVGEQISDGGDYQITFYIQTSGPFGGSQSRLPKPKSYSRFVRWPTLRQVADDLKKPAQPSFRTIR